MKFICNQQSLAKAITTVSKAVSSKTTHEILKGIRITANTNGTITLNASNLDFSIEIVIDGEVTRKGSTVVYARLFGNIIRKLPNGDITIEVGNDGNVNITNETSEFNIFGQSSDDWPTIIKSDDIQNSYIFEKDVFQHMIRKTAFATSTDETKGVIVGVLLELNENSFNMVALDGFRMAICRENILNSENTNIIISGKILTEVQKILAEYEENIDVEFKISNKSVIVIIDNTKISMRPIEGSFIKYKEILPKESNTTIVVNRSAFLTSIERASLLAKEDKNKLIRLSIESNLLTMTSRSEEGTVKEELIIEKTGDNLEIGFNAKYIIDCLKAIDDEDVKLLLNSSVTPCLIEPLNGDAFEYLVLPVRIITN